MTIREAQQVQNSFYRISNPTENDEFLFTEAMTFLINETHDSQCMMQLGGYYYEQRQFDLALKYYELAAEYNDPEAYNCLGYVWYYGRTGKRDYEKAFKYFSLAKENGDLQAAYKIADMYRNGYYVEKDYGKYKEIIEGLYSEVKDAEYLGDPLPEVFTRLARIRTEEGRTDEAVQLYLQAKDFQAQRISYNAFFGDLNIMMWLIDDLYKLIEFNRDDFDFYDMYYLLTGPCKISFSRGKKKYEIEATEDTDGLAIHFGEKYYHSREDFFKQACIGNDRLTAIYDSLHGFEVE